MRTCVPGTSPYAGAFRCRRRDSNPRHADYDRTFWRVEGLDSRSLRAVRRRPVGSFLPGVGRGAGHARNATDGGSARGFVNCEHADSGLVASRQRPAPTRGLQTPLAWRRSRAVAPPVRSPRRCSSSALCARSHDSWNQKLRAPSARSHPSASHRWFGRLPAGGDEPTPVLGAQVCAVAAGCDRANAVRLFNVLRAALGSATVSSEAIRIGRYFHTQGAW